MIRYAEVEPSPADIRREERDDQAGAGDPELVVVQSAFDGRRIVIFSGGAREDEAAIFERVRAIRDGGGFGSIIGRNSFQRPRAEALAFLGHVMAIYAGSEP